MSENVPISQQKGDHLFSSTNPSSSDPLSSNRFSLSFFDMDNAEHELDSIHDNLQQPLSPIFGNNNEIQYQEFDELDKFHFEMQSGKVSPSMPTPISYQKNDENNQEQIDFNKSVEDTNQLEYSRPNILKIINLLTEYIISHPFKVIRRQAQVNNRSKSYHLTPFTVISFMLKIQRKQGIGAFFKGLPSALVNYVFLIGCESLISNELHFPLEYNFTFDNLFSEQFFLHLLLKSLSIVVVTPFICSASIELVQSQICADTFSPLDHIKEGLARLFHFGSYRKIPFYLLIGPSLTYHLCYYLIYSVTKKTLEHYYFEKRDFGKNSDQESFQTANQSSDLMNELMSSLCAHFITDVVLYPFQTILYRLFLQGTRTLIDNVDGRTAVIPLITNYDSAIDCYQSILNQEGTPGLFKGFGALLLQYTVQASIIHLTNCCIDFLLNC